MGLDRTHGQSEVYPKIRSSISMEQQATGSRRVNEVEIEG